MPSHDSDVASLLPLPAATFHILLALVREDRHGYAIMQEVEQQTEGAVRLSAGTLYRTLQRLVDQELITETRKRPAPDLDDLRRRYYRLTPRGAAAARAEARRMDDLVRLARAQGLRLQGA